MTLRRGGIRGGGAGRRAGHANHLVGPGLVGDPLQGIVAVLGVVPVDMILTFGAVAATCVLIDRSIAVCDNTTPAAQDGTAPGLRGTRQPGPGAVGHGLDTGGGNAIGRAVQNDRVTRSTALR